MAPSNGTRATARAVPGPLHYAWVVAGITFLSLLSSAGIGASRSGLVTTISRYKPTMWRIVGFDHEHPGQLSATRRSAAMSQLGAVFPSPVRSICDNGARGGT